MKLSGFSASPRVTAFPRLRCPRCTCITPAVLSPRRLHLDVSPPPQIVRSSRTTETVLQYFSYFSPTFCHQTCILHRKSFFLQQILRFFLYWAVSRSQLFLEGCWHLLCTSEPQWAQVLRACQLPSSHKDHSSVRFTLYLFI